MLGFKSVKSVNSLDWSNQDLIKPVEKFEIKYTHIEYFKPCCNHVERDIANEITALKYLT
mgnify:CR=1 FL=1